MYITFKVKPINLYVLNIYEKRTAVKYLFLLLRRYASIPTLFSKCIGSRRFFYTYNKETILLLIIFLLFEFRIENIFYNI